MLKIIKKTIEDQKWWMDGWTDGWMNICIVRSVDFENVQLDKHLQPNCECETPIEEK